MVSTTNVRLPRRFLATISSPRSHHQSRQTTLRLLTPRIHHRSLQASSSSSSSPPPPRSSSQQRPKPDPSKPIILEQPDKFRPPSHPARLNSRRTTGSHYASYDGAAAYNQRATEQERESQRNRTYPHMFPNPGTLMYKFLTNRAIHLWITLGTLSLLALTTLIQSFVQTSPFAHLLPPVSNLFYQPLSYLREVFSVYRLSIDYQTEQTWQSRQAKIADAQKRRLYRRAHGMEDLDAQEDQGIDVRGLVEWDDGLTKRERESMGGERRMFEMSRRGMEVLTGRKIGEGEEVVGGRVVKKGAGAAEVGVETLDDDVVVALGSDGRAVLDGSRAEAATDGEEDRPPPPPQQQRKRVKRWFGIWE